jgi:hypothetical protein
MSIVPSSTTDRKKIKAGLVEITRCFQRVEDEQESVKEIINDLSQAFTIKKPLLRRLAKTLYKRSYSDVQQENEEFEEMYEILVKDAAQQTAIEEDLAELEEV